MSSGSLIVDLASCTSTDTVPVSKSSPLPALPFLNSTEEAQNRNPTHPQTNLTLYQTVTELLTAPLAPGPANRPFLNILG